MATSVATPAWAYWTSSGSASGTAATGTLSPPTGVSVPATAAGEVGVSWTAGVGGVVPTGYFVTRDDGTTAEPACASGPTDLIVVTGCADVAVRDGTYNYVVTAVYKSWTAASFASDDVTVENAAAVAFAVEPTDTPVSAPITPAITVALRTAAGDPFPSLGVPVTLAIDNNPAGGILTGETTVDTDADGLATFDDISISQAGVGYTLTASSPGLTDGTSAPFTVSVPPLLGAAQSYSILAVTAVVNTGATTVSGDVGVSPAGTISGFPTGAIGGDIHLNDAAAAAAQSARGAAYTDLKGRTADAQIVTDLGGRTFLPGTYHSTAALALTGTVILDGNSDPNAIFIFQTDAAFNTAAGSVVTLINGAKAENVYWVAVGAAGTGAGAHHAGTIVSQGAITLGAGTELIGRALSAGTVTLAGSTIRFTAALPPTITIDGGGAATTKDTTPTIAGTSNAAPASPVTVHVDGQTLQTNVGSGGTWSVTATVLGASSYEVVARVRDAAGNGTAVSQTLTVEVNPAPVDLGTAGSFAVLAKTFVTNTGTTVVTGDLGVSPGSAVTGFDPPSAVSGTKYLNDSVAAAAQVDLLAAIDQASARTPHTTITGDLGGKTFHIGIHHQTAAMALTGAVTLDAEGDPNAVFIFHTDAAFNTAAGSSVLLANSAQAANVYWVVAGAAGTGASSSVSGTILAKGAITLGAGTNLAGRALSRDGVTLAGNTITIPGFAGFARQRQAMGSTGGDLSVAETPAQPAPETPAQPTPETPAQPTPPSLAVSPLTTPAPLRDSALSTTPEETTGSPQAAEPGPTTGHGATEEVAMP